MAWHFSRWGGGGGGGCYPWSRDTAYLAGIGLGLAVSCFGYVNDLRSVSLIILQWNSGTVKAETDVDVVNAEHPIGMEAAEVHLPSAFGINISEPKVSLSFSFFLVAVAYACTYICVKKNSLFLVAVAYTCTYKCVKKNSLKILVLISGQLVLHF